jgi:hypothetical protein
MCLFITELVCYLTNKLKQILPIEDALLLSHTVYLIRDVLVILLINVVDDSDRIDTQLYDNSNQGQIHTEVINRIKEDDDIDLT